MPTQTTIPELIRREINNEAIIYSCQTSRNKRLNAGAFLGLGMGATILLIFNTIFFIRPVFFGSSIRINSTSITASPDTDILFLSLGLISYFLFALCLFGLKKEGFTPLPSFITITDTRLLLYQTGNIETYDWNEFKTDIQQKGFNQNGGIILKLKDTQSTQKVYLLGITNRDQLFRVCSEQIQQFG